MLHLAIVLSVGARAAAPVFPVLSPPPRLATAFGPVRRIAPDDHGGTAAAPDAPAAPAPEPAPGAVPLRPFDDVLGEAKELYFQGDTDRARELLEGLQLRVYEGEAPPWELVVDALVYLGDIYYNLGRPDQAEITFQFLLERDPDTPISPFHHPMEVVYLFDNVKKKVLAARIVPPEPPPPEPSPLPLWSFLPFGVPQLLQGRTAVGVTYGLLQLGLGAASVGLYVQANRLNPEDGDPGDDHPLWPKNQIPIEVDRLKYTLQWPATFGFYGVWGISMIDAGVWHARHPQGVREGASRLPAPLLRVGGRF